MRHYLLLVLLLLFYIAIFILITSVFCQVVPVRAVRAIVSAQGEAIAAVSEQFASVRVEEDVQETLKHQKDSLLEEKRILQEEIDGETAKLTSTRSALQALSADHTETNNNIRYLINLRFKKYHQVEILTEQT